MMTYNDRKLVYERAIERWGIKGQLLMVIEEMSELTKEICKSFRGRDNLDEIAEETADVLIMIEQLRMILGIDDMIKTHMDQKIERLAERVVVEVE